MNKLKHRRDELAEKWWAKFNQGTPIVTHARSVYRAGFDAAVAELMPEIEKMVAALEFECGNRCAHQNPCNAREALTNVKEFMGEK